MTESPTKSTLRTHKFVRKPFYVDAVRVSESNIEEVAAWCSGSIEIQGDAGRAEEEVRFIKVEVHRPMTDRQTMAFIGDWVLRTNSGFKVFTPKAFDKSFEKVKTLTKEQADEAGITVPHEPRPGKKPSGDKRPVPAPPKNRPPRVGTVGEAFKEAELRAAALTLKDNLHVKGSDNRLTHPEATEDKEESTVVENSEPKVIENPEVNVVFEEPKKSKVDLEVEALLAQVEALKSQS